MSDLQGRRALIMGMDNEAGYPEAQAKIPLKGSLPTILSRLAALPEGRASVHNGTKFKPKT